ncbi:hypothetical protein P154DRAFT_527797 [Amniculicola lignicola CBS 123094]|uniref:Snf7-domain-containing protein n=1 Tax=Amniculicola lignicola CBS 123094 TaxID=1392246 RepID=A0A6A5VV33_9PLEO|nr:hypothetical protein P154DRAFT_527797 [Amniculicola lignicola CBS 123094]
MDPLLEFLVTHEEAFKSQGRLASLYSDFTSQKATNFDGYNANILAWKKALADAARAGVIPAQAGTRDLLNIRTGEELARALQHKTCGRPMCLSAVFHDAVERREMMPLTDFLNSPTSIYKTSWLPSAWSAMTWGLRRAGVIGEPKFSHKMEVANFVVLANVEAASTEILKQIEQLPSAADRILSRAEFLRRFDRVLNPAASMSQTDLNIILAHLARDKGAISYNAQTIKFKADAESEPTPVTSEDAAIANLRDTITKMEAQIAPLEERVAAAGAAAREAVHAKQMTRAKVALRSKKMAETALAHRSDVLLQLEEVYTKLQHAVDHVEIVEAMKLGAAALKGLNEKVGGAEGVTKVVDALRDGMDTADEITTIINESGEHIDETEVDEEFEALEEAEREKREQEEAAKTAARLAELEQVERQRREKEAAEKQKAAEEKVEEDVVTASQTLSRLSFEAPPETDDEEEKIPIAA